ncbi:hypothetical protein DRP04_00005, partial [Archaeoglobales archaeon]
EWYFVTVTWKMISDTSSEIKIYVDGELKVTHDAGHLSEKTEDTKTWIGTYGVNKYFDGIIDEVRIYNRALSDEEIKVIYENNTFIRDGLVAYWRFDEGSGSIAHDTHHLVYPDNTEGAVAGKAMSFDGSNDYVKVPDSPSFDFSSGVTVSAWVKTERTGISQNIVTRVGEITLRMDVYGNAIFSINDGTGWKEANSGEKLTDGKWHFVTGTYDNLEVKIYVDGELKTTYSYTTTIQDTVNPILIGSGSGSAYTEAVIDDVRIYNRALSPEEIKALYLLTKNKYDGQFTIVNYTVASTPEVLDKDKLRITLTPTDELTDLHKLVFLPAAATHSYDLISTDTDYYGNTLQVVEVTPTDTDLTFDITITEPHPDGIALAAWEYSEEVHFTADPAIYSVPITLNWKIFSWAIDNFTKIFTHRSNELVPGDMFTFKKTQTAIVSDGYIASTHPIAKTDRGLVISDSEFAVEPQADTIIYLTEFNPAAVREGRSTKLAEFTVNTQYHDQNITFIITNLTAGKTFDIYKNGELLKNVTTLDNGTLIFTDTGFSPTNYTIVAAAPAIIIAPPISALPTLPELPQLKPAIESVSYVIASALVLLTIAVIARRIKK